MHKYLKPMEPNARLQHYSIKSGFPKAKKPNLTKTWCSKWQEELMDDGSRYGVWLQPHAEDGIAQCTICNAKINYSRSGKSAIQRHAKTVKHIKMTTCIKSNSSIPGKYYVRLEIIYLYLNFCTPPTG